MVREYTPLYRELLGLTKESARRLALEGVVCLGLALLLARSMARSTARHLRWKTALLEAQLNASLDGILVVDGNGRQVVQNRQATDLFKIPAPIADGNDDAAKIRWVANVVKDHEQFVERITFLYSHPDETGRDEIELKDGTVLDRYSAPVIGADGTYHGRIWTFRDFTERRRTEQAMDRTLRRLEEAQRVGQIGDWEWDLATQAITWSPQMFAIVGRDPRLGPPRTCPELAAHFHPASWAWMEAKAMATLESGEPHDYELLAVRPDGQQVHVEVMALARKDESGQVVGLYGTLQDISARKRAEAAQRESDARYRALFENMLEGCAHCRVVRHEGDVVDIIYLEVNDAFAKLTGLKDVVGKSISEVLPGVYEANPELFEMYLRVAATGQPERCETYLKCLAFWFSISVYSHEKEHFVVVFDNITDRKRIEEELSRSRETLDRVLNQIPQRVFWKDRNLVYRGCNRAFAVDMGYRDPGEVIGKTDFDATWKGVAELYRADDRAVMEANAPKTSFEEPGIAANGEAGWLRTSKTPLHDAEGNITGVLGTYEDVTEHKRAKLEIERLNRHLEQRVAERTQSLAIATAEAERANRAKSEFLSRMSHELRTPMNAILGFAQVLEGEAGLTADQRDSVDQIMRGGRHLLGLINEVLDISSIEAGRLTLSSEPVALAGLLEESVGLLRPLAAQMQIQIVVINAANPGGHMQADRQRLKQVLLNLIGNAIKYNRFGGHVRVRHALVDGAPGTTRLSVSDTGPGLAAEQLARLFSPFERLGAEQTRVEGTGLGLVLARRMVEHMGGRLGVESVVGEGSTFWIELPTAEAAVETDSAVEADNTCEAGPAISEEARVLLYIEDNPSNVRLVTRILARRPGVVLICAETGARGLEMAREHRPDLILLDLHLPDSHGAEVLARLAIDPRTGAIPVVILTADVVPGKRTELLGSGARAFIAKPLDVRNFLSVVDQFLGLPVG